MKSALDTKLTFPYMRILISTSAANTLSFVNPDMPQMINEMLEKLVNAFCVTTGDLPVESAKIDVLMHNCRMGVMSTLSGYASGIVNPDDFLAAVSYSITFCCLYIPERESLVLVVDMLNTMYVADPLRHFSVFQYSENEFNRIH